MKKTAVLLALLLGACASPAQLRGGKADIDVVTAKPADRVAGCIGDAFEKSTVTVAFAPSQTFATRPTADGGFSISGTQSNGFASDTIILVDVAKSEGGTHVTMYDHFIVSGGGKWATLVRNCL